MVKVVTAYLDSFKYPKNCVACGQPAGARSLSVSKSKSSSKYHHTSLYMSFPLCDADADIHAAYSKKLKPLNLVNAISLLGFIVVIGLLLKLLANQPALKTWGIILAVIFAVVFITTAVLRFKIMNEDKEKSAAYKKIAHSVRIANYQQPSIINKKGTVKLEFEDAAYANDFAQLNEGVLSD